MIKKHSLYLWYFILGLVGAIVSFLLPIFIVQIAGIYEGISLILTRIASEFFVVPHEFDAITYVIIYSLPAFPFYLLSFFLPAPQKQFEENGWFVLLSLLSYFSGMLTIIAVILLIALLSLRG